MTLRLLAVGDILLRARAEEQNPFIYVQDVLREGDIVFGNLEAAIANIDEPDIEKATLLKVSQQNTFFLKKANCI